MCSYTLNAFTLSRYFYHDIFRTLATLKIILWMEFLNLPVPTNPQTNALVLCRNPAVRGWLNSAELHPP